MRAIVIKEYDLEFAACRAHGIEYDGYALLDIKHVDDNKAFVTVNEEQTYFFESFEDPDGNVYMKAFDVMM